MNYLITITPDTFVTVHFLASVHVAEALSPEIMTQDRLALIEGRPVRMLTVIRCLSHNPHIIRNLQVILPEGTPIEVQAPRKFTLPLIQEFVEDQRKKGEA
jgi:hypothetical protein